MTSIVARIVVSALLLPVFVALVVEAWRDGGVAAPILGR
jgi:hypothetical protein